MVKTKSKQEEGKKITIDYLNPRYIVGSSSITDSLIFGKDNWVLGEIMENGKVKIKYGPCSVKQQLELREYLVTKGIPIKEVHVNRTYRSYVHKYSESDYILRLFHRNFQRLPDILPKGLAGKVS